MAAERARLPGVDDVEDAGGGVRIEGTAQAAVCKCVLEGIQERRQGGAGMHPGDSEGLGGHCERFYPARRRGAWAELPTPA
jgi:hypothetical protein